MPLFFRSCTHLRSSVVSRNDPQRNRTCARSSYACQYNCTMDGKRHIVCHVSIDSYQKTKLKGADMCRCFNLAYGATNRVILKRHCGLLWACQREPQATNILDFGDDRVVMWEAERWLQLQVVYGMGASSVRKAKNVGGDGVKKESSFQGK